MLEENEISGSNPESLVSCYERMRSARQARSDFQVETPRPGHRSTAQEQWDAEYAKLDQNVVSSQRDHMAALGNASPEDLEALRVKIGESRQDLTASISKRRGISHHSSDETSQSEVQVSTHSDVQISSAGNLSDRVASRRAMSDGQDQDGEDGGQRAGRRLQPNWAAYAETNDDRESARQLEDDQRTLHQRLNRPATHEEVVAFQEARKAEAQQELVGTSTYAQRTERREEQSQSPSRSEVHQRERNDRVQQRDDFGMSM